MLRFFKYAVTLLIGVAAVACCDKGSSSEVDHGYVPYEPPVTINPANLFNLCIFTELTNQSLFITHTQSAISSFINGYSGQKPLVYFIERSDFMSGQPIAHLSVALDTKCYSFFAPQSDTAADVRGTAILTRYTVSDFDGILCDSLRMSGCRFSAPLSETTNITVYTARIDDLSQIKALVARRGAVLQVDGMVVGSMNATIKEDAKEFLRKKFSYYRLVFAESKGMPYDMFVLTPVNFVCRTITDGQTVSIPYYVISIEQLIQTK